MNWLYASILFFTKSIEILFVTPLKLKWIPIEIPEETKSEFMKISSISEEDLEKYEIGNPERIKELQQERIQIKETQISTAQSMIKEILNLSEESKFSNKKQEVRCFKKIK